MDMNITAMASASQITNDTFFECIDDSGEYGNIHKKLLVTGSSVVIVLGTGGNIATYNVFKNRVYKNNVMANMFRYLSVLGMIFIWTIIIQILIKGLTGHHITNTTSRGCLLYVFWLMIISSLTNWLLVVITLARVVHLNCPLKTQAICSKLHYNLLLVATHFFVIGFHGGNVLLWHLRLTEADYHSGESCYYHISRADINTPTQRALYLAVNFLLPAFLLVIFNVVIVVELGAVDDRRQRLFNKTPTSSKYVVGSTTAQPNTTTTSFDKSQNALKANEIQSHAFSTPTRKAYEQSTHEVDYVTQGKEQHRRDSNCKDTLTSPLPRPPSGTRKWIPLVGGKSQTSGNCSAQRVEIRTDQALVEDRVKQKLFCLDKPAKCNFSDIIDEIEVGQNVTQRAEMSNVKLSKRNRALGDSNWNQSGVPTPMLQLSPGNPSMTRTTTASFTVKHSNQYLGVSQAAGSEVTSQSSRSQAASSGRRLSIRTWISEARSHGVDMECEEDDNADQGVQGNMDGIKELGKAGTPSGKGYMRRNSRTYNLTLMLVAASAVFILSNVPFWVIHLGFVETSKGCSLRFMVADMTYLIRYSNNCINFIFYCAIGSRFRRDFFAVFRNLCR